MHGVLAAETTILAHLELVRSVLFVLERVVVSLLALVASKGQFNSHFGTSFYIWPIRGPAASLYEQSGFCAKKQTSLPTGKMTIPYENRKVKHFLQKKCKEFTGENVRASPRAL